MTVQAMTIANAVQLYPVRHLLVHNRHILVYLCLLPSSSCFGLDDVGVGDC
jgi:hypothetical protein